MAVLIFHALFTPLAYLSFGLLLLTLLNDKKDLRKKKFLNPLSSVSDSYVAALVLSSSALVIPAVLVGTQPGGAFNLPLLGKIISFPLIFYLHGALSFSSLIYASHLFINEVILSRPTRSLEESPTDSKSSEVVTFDLLRPLETVRKVAGSPIIRRTITKTRVSIISFVGLLVLLEMSILSLIFPPMRGYDALAMYFPEARIYFLTDQITSFNPLATRPTVKSPFIILLITWSWYLFGSIQISLMPVAFVLGTALIARQLVYLLENTNNTVAKRIKADLAFTGVLVLPLTFWFLMDWPFYQDIYVGFFYASALYWIWKAQVVHDNRRKLVLYHVLAALSIACALLSKINAWTIFIILILTFPTNNKSLKVGKLIFLSGLLVFLSYKVSVNLYVGFVLLYFLWGLIIARDVLLEKYDVNLSSVFLETANKTNSRWVRFLNHQNLYLATLLGGLVLGGHWLWRNFQLFPGAREDFFSRYLKIPDFSLIKTTSSVGPGLVSSASYETIHGVSLHGIALLLFFGTLFVAFWGFFKIIGILKPEGHRKLVIWLGVYVIIWTTYYGNSSARYLSLIIVPLVIMSVHGFDYFIRRLSSGARDLGGISRPRLLIFLALAPLNYYYMPDVSILLNYNDPAIRNKIGLSYLQSAINYYLHLEIMILLGLVGLIVVLLLVDVSIVYHFVQKITSRIHLDTVVSSFKKVGARPVWSTLSVLAFFLLLVIPVIVPTTLFITNGGDLEDVVETQVLYHDESYQQVLEYLQLHFNPTDAILSFNVPGIGAQTDMPNLEVIMIPPELPLNKRPWVTASPAKDVLTFLRNPLSLEDLRPYRSYFPEKFLSSFGFTYVVVPTPIYYWWESFVVRYMQSSTLVALLDNPDYFSLVLETEYYYLFKLKDTSVDFGGVLDLQLQDKNGFKVSLLGPLSNLNSIEERNNDFERLNLVLDFSGNSYQLRGLQTLKINVTLVSVDNTTVIINESKLLSEVDGPTTITLLDASLLEQMGKSELDVHKIMIEFTLKEDLDFYKRVVLEPRDVASGILPLRLDGSSQSLVVPQVNSYFMFAH